MPSRYPANRGRAGLVTAIARAGDQGPETEALLGARGSRDDPGRGLSGKMGGFRVDVVLPRG